MVQAKAAVPGLTVEENLALTPDAALTEQQRAEARTASEILARQLGERNFYGLPPDCLDLRPTAHDSPVYTIDVHTKPCALTDLTVLLGRWRVNVTDGSAAVATRDGQYRPL